ncbi:MAG TPA: metallophosphoesterase family protein [Burkholderiales bacterium]|nr:metallophosphoesterase family protein [Burkholderiales bacterium]
MQGPASGRHVLARLSLPVLLALAGCTAHVPPPLPSAFHPPLAFALIGDTPYSEWEASALDAMIDEMNREELAFVIHVGDITGGRGPCTDEWYEARKRQFERSTHPFVIVPGDNEWVDCHRSGRDPIERLAKFRELFESGDRSLGERTLALERQGGRYAEYREHVRWIAGGVLFVGLNVQGSNNNLGRTPAMDAEHRARMAAVIAWMQDSLRLARDRNLAGMLIFAQADPEFGRGARSGRWDGFAEFRDALRDLALKFGKPVLFVNGDSHFYKLDKPLADPATGEPIPNFTRVIVFGSPQTRWIRAGIDPGAPQLFEVSPVPQSGP